MLSNGYGLSIRSAIVVFFALFSFPLAMLLFLKRNLTCGSLPTFTGHRSAPHVFSEAAGGLAKPRNSRAEAKRVRAMNLLFMEGLLSEMRVRNCWLRRITLRVVP